MEDIIKLDFSDEEGITENSFDKLAELMPELDGIQLLSGLLDLPDEEFIHIKDVTLEELEAGFNNSNDKYSLALAFNNSNLSSKELHQAFAYTLDKIDEEFSQHSEMKRSFLKQVITMMINSLEKGKGLHNRILEIPIELCDERAKMPTYAHDGDAGCDVYTLEDIEVAAHSTILVPLGFKVAIPAGYEIQMRPRSGMSLKTKIRVANAPGTIDASYRGEVGVILDNIGDYPFSIIKGQRIAQMVLSEVPVASFYEVKNIGEFESERASGGFGSSGK